MDKEIFIEYFKTNYSGSRAANIWLKDINFEKKRIVYYSQRTDSLLDEDSIKIIENDGYSWLKNEKMYHYRSYFLKIKEIISIIKNKGFSSTVISNKTCSQNCIKSCCIN